MGIREDRHKEGERPEWRGGASCWYLCIGVQTLLGASGVDVVQLLLLLRLDVLVLLHSAGILHVGPVGRQHHQIVDLRGRCQLNLVFLY